MNEETLFDSGEGRARRDEAIERVEAHADTAWKDSARACLVYVASRKEHFTADDVAEELGSWVGGGTHEPRAMGAIFLWARREKIAEPTSEFRATRRPQGHAGPRRVWKSLVI